MDLDGMSGLHLFHTLVESESKAADPRKREFIANLPTVTENDLVSLDHKDSCCPICFTPFLAVLASEEMALAMESPALSSEELGVTRLVETCGHLFCRKDITTWIQQHDTCPTCRQPFIILPSPQPGDTATIRSEGPNRLVTVDSLSGVRLADESSDERRRIWELLHLVSQDSQHPSFDEFANDGQSGHLDQNDEVNGLHGVDTHTNDHDDRGDYIGMYS